MREHTQPQTQTQSQSHDSTTTTAATAMATDESPSPSPQPPPTLPLPLSKPTTSKLPFRPRKIRKVTATVTPTTKSIIQHIRIPQNLSSSSEIELALRHLTSSDPLLAPLISTHPPPSFTSTHPPFLSLTKSILYQQLATKAATSIYARFVSLFGGESAILPESVLSFTPQQLREIGVSGRKASYLHDLANKYRTGILLDSSILDMDDKSLFTTLTMVKGIGPWSVHMFMIFSLRRPDVLPVGDLGVRKGVQLLYGLKQLPKPSEMEQLCDKWRPYRSVGSWYMWRLVEAKGVPANTAAAEVSASQLQQLIPISSVPNLG